jgi:hypothetical protein
MTPELQKRHFDYVLGPNQDTRLASVATGTFAAPNTITGIELRLESDAPFVLTSRSVRAKANVTSLSPYAIQVLSGLETQWSGPTRDFRQSGGVGGGRTAYVPESLQMIYYGLYGNPKPIQPGILFPAGSILTLNLRYTGTGGLSTALTNLSFYFRGYKLYPKGTVAPYTYPTKFATQTFSYPVPVIGLGVSETRRGQIFTCKPDADFVLRAGQWIGPNGAVNGVSGRSLTEVSMILRDANKLPYSNDFVPLDVLFGSGGTGAAVDILPSAITGVIINTNGTGPGSPGLIYPEIYLPQNHQLIYDIQRADGTSGSNTSEDFTFNFIGSKVFKK